jgi:coenzyme PQQ synthesis protein D (PqqD)
VSNERPARVAGLEAHEVDDGLIVYQPSTDRVHYLNATAAVVYELCSGELSEAEIAARVGEAWELAQPPDAAVRECLSQLRHEGVVT